MAVPAEAQTTAEQVAVATSSSSTNPFVYDSPITLYERAKVRKRSDMQFKFTSDHQAAELSLCSDPSYFYQCALRLYSPHWF